jgi:hypothetical protein
LCTRQFKILLNTVGTITGWGAIGHKYLSSLINLRQTQKQLKRRDEIALNEDGGEDGGGGPVTGDDGDIVEPLFEGIDFGHLFECSECMRRGIDEVGSRPSMERTEEMKRVVMVFLAACFLVLSCW